MMDNLKFVIFSILVVGLFFGATYWALTTMESGSSHVDNQKVKNLEDKNEDLEKKVSDLTRENDLLKTKKEETKVDDSAQEQPAIVKDNIEPVKTTTPTKTTTTTTTTKTYKYQTLINELQKLVDGNVYLKLKSTGSAVGTVQKFLNIYNNTSNKVDNDYGASTVTAVKNFQKAEKIIADGEAGSGTFKKMIAWLKTK